MTPAAVAEARERVVVAMSGGVDSSVAAALAAAEGFEAIGVTLHLAGDASRCCGIQDADDARRVAERLGMRFFVANYREQFQSEVVEAFADDYLAGRTPIPCVACNKKFKFDYLLERARLFGATRVVTGHYARVTHDAAAQRYRLLRAADRAKDQSYFLFQLDQAQLARVWFPLGEMSKAQVRERARSLALETAEKPESQEICFVPDGDYARVVERMRPEARGHAGEIVDEAGNVLGRHAGVHHFTVGQRRGLGVALGRPAYVSAIDAERQRLVVGDKASVLARSSRLEGVSWVAGAVPGAPVRAQVQVRHRHTGAWSTVSPLAGDRARVDFDEAVAAVAPGQAAVFYDGDEVLGGGWIARSAR